MFGWLILGCVAAAAWKMADFEDRTPWPWAVGAAIAAWFLPGFLGPAALAAPLIALALVFAGLWILRSRDGDGGGKIIR